MNGEQLTGGHIGGTDALLLLAGMDATWSAIVASPWHRARHPEDRRRPGEELPGFHAPVTMARIVAEDVDVGGACMEANDSAFLPFSVANRDPEAFEGARLLPVRILSS